MTQLKKGELTESEKSFVVSNSDKLIKVLKNLFLFLPGNFLLFLFSYGILFMTFSFGLGEFNLMHAIFWLILTGFMVMFGVGDIKNPKHTAIPLSTFGLALLTYLTAIFLGDAIPGNIGLHAIYLFPLILITPLLTKSIVETLEKPIEETI